MPLESFLRQLPQARLASPARIVVGFSGGLDSTVLLHALRPLYAGRMHAVHVNHGLHPAAGEWARHCQRICAAWGVPLSVVNIEVAQDGRGLEAAARDARHAAFASQLDVGDILALAQHQDDQAETFLLHALRGSGPDGLSAMPHVQERNGCHWWRPWLDVPRAELAAYARTHALDWVEDPSNVDPRFDRNYLRHAVMPLLHARWPHASAALARCAQLQRETRTDLAATTTEMLDACATAEGDLLLDALMRHSVEARARILRAWARDRGLPPLGRTHLQHIERDLLAARHDAEPQFTWSNARILRWRDVLHASLQEPPSKVMQQSWDGREPLPLPSGRQWRLAPARAFGKPFAVVARAGGERIQLPGRRHRTEVKKLLQAMGIPAWQRSGLPLLVDELGEVHAIPGIAISDALSKWLQANGCELIHDTAIDLDTVVGHT